MNRSRKGLLNFLRRSDHSGLPDNELEASVHWSKKKLADMVARDWRALREEFEIFVRGRKIPNPLRGWADISLPETLQKQSEQPAPAKMLVCASGTLQTVHYIGTVLYTSLHVDER